MPYIKPAERPQYEELVEELASILAAKPHTVRAGHLNYVVSSVVRRMLRKTEGRYKDHNDIMGALICLMLEFYSMDTRPYEDEKIDQNGDIVGSD